MKKFVTILYLLCICIYLNAQSITGVVLDSEDKKPLPFANIQLFDADSIYIDGCTTLENGFFSIEKAGISKNEKPFLKVSYVGYETAIVPIETYDIGKISLHLQSQTLGEVVVRSHARPFTMKGNAIVANISASSLRYLDNIYRVLPYLPGVFTDKGEISVFGKGKPDIYVNDRKLLDLSELERIKPSDVSTIEIIRNAGATYGATTGSIIKIRTKRNNIDGLSLMATSFYQQGHRASFQERIQANYHKNGLDVFATLSGISYQQKQESEYTFSLLDAEQPLFSSVGQQLTKTRQYLARTGFDYYFNNSNSAGAYYSILYKQVRGSQSQVTDDSQSLYDYATSFRNNSPTHRIGAYYMGTLNKTKLSANLEYYHQNQSENETTIETEQNTLNPTDINTDNSLNNSLIVAQLQSDTKIGKNNLIVLGTEYSYTDRNNQYTNSEGILMENHQNVNQNRYAVYASYTRDIGNLELNLGMRYEYLGMKYNNELDGNRNFSRYYSGLYPSASVSYKLGKWDLNLSYSRKTNQPSYNQIDGNVEYITRYNYMSGNLALEPEFTHNISMSIYHKGLLLSADYIIKDNAIIRYFKRYNNNPDIILDTYSNYKDAKNIVVGLSYSKTFFSIWTPGVSANMKFSNIDLNVGLDDTDGSLNTHKSHFKTPYSSFSFNSSIDLPHEWNIFIDGVYRLHGYDDGIYMYDSGRVSLDVTKSWKHWSIDIFFNDIFRTSKDHTHRKSNICTYYFDGYNDKQNIQITIKYRFNVKQSKYKGKNIADKDIMRL